MILNIVRIEAFGCEQVFLYGTVQQLSPENAVSHGIRAIFELRHVASVTDSLADDGTDKLLEDGEIDRYIRYNRSFRLRGTRSQASSGTAISHSD